MKKTVTYICEFCDKQSDHEDTIAACEEKHTYDTAEYTLFKVRKIYDASKPPTRVFVQHKTTNKVYVYAFEKLL